MSHYKKYSDEGVKKTWLIFILSLFNIFSYAQTELRLSAGIIDVPGLSIEQSFKRFGIDVSGSFWRKDKPMNWHGPCIDRYDKYFMNLAFKIYLSKKVNAAGFFVGVYARRRATDVQTIRTAEPDQDFKAWLDTIDQPVTYRTITTKISVGVLAGYKCLIKDHLVIEVNYGFGYAPYYVTVQKNYNRPDIKYTNGTSDSFGYLGNISIYGHAIIGYRFGKPKKKKE